jgi:hypothetical protein
MLTKKIGLIFPLLLHAAALASAVALSIPPGDRGSRDVKLTLNPYSAIDWSNVRHHKANFHTHSNGHKVLPDGTIVYANGAIIGADGESVRGPVEGHIHEWRDPHPDFVNAEGLQAGSDGLLRVDQVIDAYRDLGYTILSLTDHDRVTWPWESYHRTPRELGMLAIVGNEFTRNIHHTISLFTDYAPEWGENRDLDELLAGVTAARGLAIIAHPTRDWPLNFIDPQQRSLDVSLDSDLRGITTGDFTIETWFRTEEAGRGVLLGNYRAAGTAALNLELQSNNRVRVFLHTPGAGPTVDINVAADTLGVNTRDGRWHHLAATREGSTVRLYLDGQEIGNSVEAGGLMPLGGDTVHLGRDTRADSTAFKGSLDQVRFWQRALSAAEISAIQSAQTPQGEGLLRHYAFNPDGRIPADGDAPDPAMLADASASSDPARSARVSDTDQPRVDRSVPPVLGEAGLSTASLRFGPPPPPDPADGVPEVVLQRYLDIFRQNPATIGIEVLNGTRSSDYAHDRSLWDEILTRLMPERPVWGFANDDLHSLEQLGRDWNVVLADSLDEQSVRKALEKGAFFFASTKPAGENAAVPATPEIRAIRHDPQQSTLTAEALENGRPSSDSAYAWIANGKTLHVGPVLNYRDLPADTRYVRLEVSGQGGVIHSNPFGFQVR